MSVEVDAERLSAGEVVRLFSEVTGDDTFRDHSSFPRNPASIAKQAVQAVAACAVEPALKKIEAGEVDLGVFKDDGALELALFVIYGSGIFVIDEKGRDLALTSKALFERETEEGGFEKDAFGESWLPNEDFLYADNEVRARLASGLLVAFASAASAYDALEPKGIYGEEEWEIARCAEPKHRRALRAAVRTLVPRPAQVMIGLDVPSEEMTESQKKLVEKAAEKQREAREEGGRAGALSEKLREVAEPMAGLIAEEWRFLRKSGRVEDNIGWGFRPSWMNILKKACTWKEQEWHEAWESSCDNMWQMTNGTPKENNMGFCPFCGGYLLEERAFEANL